MSGVTSYRSRPAQFSESESSSSDEDEDQPWKRQKRFSKSQQETPMMVASVKESTEPSKSTTASGLKRKRNNVWGEVVQQQEEEQVARDITQFDMYSNKERDVESYNYQSWDDGTAKQKPLGNPITYGDSVANQNRKLPEAVGGSNDDSWLVDDEVKTQTAVKNRLGTKEDMNHKDHTERLKEYGNEMKFVELSSDMHRKDVAGKIAYSLQEPKRDMVKVVVEELGIKKSINVWKETWDIEQTGGMMVNNGSRRRTPGGVFFQLLKKDPEITSEKKEVIFAMSNSQSKQEGKSRRRRMRRKQRITQMETEFDVADALRNEVERQKREETKEQMKQDECSEEEKHNPSRSTSERSTEVLEAGRHEENQREMKDIEDIGPSAGQKPKPDDDMEEGEISD